MENKGKGEGGGEGGGWGRDRQRNRQVNAQALSKLLFSNLPFDLPELRDSECFCPDQALLSKNFHSRPGCRRQILSIEFWGWGGGQNLILNVDKMSAP